MVEFGDGSRLRLWEQEVYDGYWGEWVLGLFVEYRYPDQRIYRYDTDQLVWSQVSRTLLRSDE